MRTNDFRLVHFIYIVPVIALAVVASLLNWPAYGLRHPLEENDSGVFKVYHGLIVLVGLIWCGLIIGA